MSADDNQGTDNQSAAGLELIDVSVRFRDGDEYQSILHGLSLSVQRSEVVSVSGRSGSGKSTLLGVAGLLRTPDSSSISLAGNACAELSNRDRTTMRRNHVGMIFQSAELFPSLTAIQQLLLIADINSESARSNMAKATELLESVGLAHRANHRPGQLSGGERQRVGIARALMSDPAVILADEPTASLDPERSEEIMELLTTEARRHNAATVIVSHDPAHSAFTDRTYRLESGQVHLI